MHFDVNPPPHSTLGASSEGVGGLCSQRDSYCYYYTALLRQSIKQFNSHWKYMWGEFDRLGLIIPCRPPTPPPEGALVGVGVTLK